MLRRRVGLTGRKIQVIVIKRAHTSALHRSSRLCGLGFKVLSGTSTLLRSRAVGNPDSSPITSDKRCSGPMRLGHWQLAADER